MTPDTVIDLSESRAITVDVGGFESFCIRAPAWGVERRLWSTYAHPHRVNAGAFVDELLAGSLRPRRTRAEVAAFPVHIRARLRVALVKALRESSRWRSLYGSFLSPDERLYALMLWRSKRLARDAAELAGGVGRRLRRAARGDAVSPKAGLATGGLAGRAMDSLARRDHTVAVATGDVLDKRFSALNLALGRTGTPARSAIERFMSAKGFASGLFGHGHDDLYTGLDVGSVLDRAVGRPGFPTVASANPLCGADIRNRTAALRSTNDVLHRSVFGAKTKPSIVGKLARGAMSPTARFGAWVGQPSFVSSLSAAIGGKRGRLSFDIREDTLRNVAGFDHAGRVGRSPLFASVFKEAQPRFVFKDSAVPWLSSLVPGLRRGRGFDIVGDARSRFADLGKFAQPALEALRHLQEHSAALELFERRWERDALWYLLSHLEVRHVVRLSEMDREEVEAVLLDALEGAVRDEEFAMALRDGVGHAQILSNSQREHLRHALEHARAGEWLHAEPPLTRGLEGAFWATARARSLITPNRSYASNPKKKIHGVENVVKLIAADDGFSLFVRRRVFGTTGDPFRHGDVDGGERRQVLLCIAALCGWIDAFVALPALPVLSAELNEHMPEALDRAQTKQLPPGG